jgi:hypothetical protein
LAAGFSSCCFPELGLHAPYAVEAPFVCNERVDEETLFRIGGAVLPVVLGGEFGEIAGGLVEHDLVSGGDAVFFQRCSEMRIEPGRVTRAAS